MIVLNCECNVALCVRSCFEKYRRKKNFETLNIRILINWGSFLFNVTQWHSTP